eukprot:930636-Prorocentrum_minimum.AAC.2
MRNAGMREVNKKCQKRPRRATHKVNKSAVLRRKRPRRAIQKVNKSGIASSNCFACPRLATAAQRRM